MRNHENIKIIPHEVMNWIDGEEIRAENKETFNKLSPHSGEVICKVTRSSKLEINRAVLIAKQAQIRWANTPAVQREIFCTKSVMH